MCKRLPSFFLNNFGAARNTIAVIAAPAISHTHPGGALLVLRRAWFLARGVAINFSNYFFIAVCLIHIFSGVPTPSRFRPLARTCLVAQASVSFALRSTAFSTSTGVL